MDRVYSNFYKKFYSRTNGYLPTNPLNLNVYPGDFFQIRNGEMIILGNVFRKRILNPDDAVIRSKIKLNPVDWYFNDGVTKPYSGRSTGNNIIDGSYEFSKQILAFNKYGSFNFKGNQPESVRISNWQDLQNELIIKLTTTYYSFREIYIIYDVAHTKDWTLAVASSESAELEIALNSEDFGLVDNFGHAGSKTIQTKDLEFYQREEKRRTSFFKAKKLVVQDDRCEVFISDLLGDRNYQDTWARDFFDFEVPETLTFAPSRNDVKGSVLDMLQINELNPNTALQYFHWEDANLDDVNKFFEYAR